MKKEAVKTRPMARVKTESVGYHESGTGLVIGFGAFNINQKHRIRKLKLQLRRQKQNKIELPSQNAEIRAPDLARSKTPLSLADSNSILYFNVSNGSEIASQSPYTTLAISPTFEAQHLLTVALSFKLL